MSYGAHCQTRKNMKAGGRVSGPGTGTSDSIPANLSNDEYVIPADSTRKIGVHKLDALVAATHKPVSGSYPQLANGGAVRMGVGKKRGYADGGLVTDEEKKRPVQYAGGIPTTDASGAALPAAPVAPAPAVAASPAPTGFLNNTDAALRLSGQDANEQAAQGNYGAAAGAAARGLLAAVPATVADLAEGLAPVVRGAKGFVSSFLGDSSTPAPAPAQPALGVSSPNRQALQPAAAVGAVQPAPAAPSPATEPQAAASPQVQPSIVKTYVDENGKPTGKVIKVYPTPAAPAPPALAESDPLTRQQALFDRARLLAAEGDPRTIAHRTARYAQALGVNTAGVTQERQNALNQQAGKVDAETKLAVSTFNARAQYAKALQSGDPVAIVRAEAMLRGFQGKYEKDPNPVRHLVVQGGQQVIDGQLVHQPSVVFDPDSKQFLAPPTQGVGATQPLANHIEALKRNPQLAAQFDKQYGTGTAAKYLGSK